MKNALTVLDAGCGTGYVINHLSNSLRNTYFIGVDYQPPCEDIVNSRVDYRSGDLLKELRKIKDNSIEFVVCAQVIEHLTSPEDVVRHLKRIACKCLIIICPLEKKYRWGMNYHVNFFPNSHHFISFLRSAFSGDTAQALDGVIHERLGDIMYVETYG